MNPCKQAKNYFLNSEHGVNISEKAFRIAFKLGKDKNNWRNYLMKWIIMQNNLMLDGQTGKMNKNACNLESQRSALQCHRI